ncbi:MAG: hypothetical protein CFH05_01455, partial [Alphaproteobacteria bacterium MarineAlpha3_Bin4]
IEYAVALDPGELFDAGAFVAALFAVSRTDIIRGRMVLVRELIAAVADPDSAADAIGRTVSVHESMPFAIYVFLANPKSFVDCLYTAALNGGRPGHIGGHGIGRFWCLSRHRGVTGVVAGQCREPGRYGNTRPTHGQAGGLRPAGGKKSRPKAPLASPFA